MNSNRTKINISALATDIVRRRTQRKVPQKDFAELISMSPQALCRLESGKNLPNSKTLAQIEKILELPSGFYTRMRDRIKSNTYRDGADEHCKPESRFRPIYANHTFDPEKLGRLTRELARRTEEYVKYETSLGLPHFDQFYLDAMDMDTGLDGVQAADEFRRQLGIECAPIYSMIHLLEQKNIRIVPTRGLAPVVIPETERDQWRHSFPFHDLRDDNLVIAVNTTSPAHSQLYGIAYAIAAYVRYRHFDLAGITPQNADESEFCRAFASELTTPFDSLSELMGTLRIGEREMSVGSLDAVANYYGISSTALVWTLWRFGLVSTETFERLKAELKKTTLPDRPPLQFCTWLDTLKSCAS